MEITEKVWDLDFDPGTNVVDVYVNILRKKIDKQFENKLIHTRVGMGYYLDDLLLRSNYALRPSTSRMHSSSGLC